MIRVENTNRENLNVHFWKHCNLRVATFNACLAGWYGSLGLDITSKKVREKKLEPFQKLEIIIRNTCLKKTSWLWKELKSNLTEITKNDYFQKVTEIGFANNKKFWNAAKPFLTSKSFLINNYITKKIKDESVTYKAKLANLFNSHYINNVKNAYIFIQVYLHSSRIILATKMKTILLY